MRIELDPVETRILGCLVEKEKTTPDLYPLTLNGLVNACNQKTSREPVMTLDEAAVGKGLHSLIEKSLAGRLHEPGGRVPKFMHHVELLLSGATEQQIAVLAVLFLRGPQTAGELKTRTDRLCTFASAAEVESLLQELAGRPEPWVERLARQPGQKEARYRHLFGAASAAAAEPAAASAPAASSAPAPAPDRLAELERRVAALEALVLKGAPPESGAAA